MKKLESTREACELDYFQCKSIEFLLDNQDYIKIIPDTLTAQAYITTDLE